MRPVQARLVTLCQQVLALGVVLVVLTPASGVVSLDIVGEHAGGASSGGHRAAPAELMSATVPTGAVKPTVTEVPLTGATGGFAGLRGRTVAGGATDARVQSKPQSVVGFAAIGVTWQHGEDLEEDQISLQVRTRTGDEWSDWEALEYHDEHGPDDGSAEAAASRPGTEPTFVGEVDDVQVQASTTGATLPDDLSLALVDPGSAKSSESEAAADKGADKGGDGDGVSSYEEDFAEQGSLMGDSDGSGITLQAAPTNAKAAKAAAQPTIYSRAQWGADESIRNKGSLRYGTINGGFVHHTVNANDYTEEQVPAIIRSIYAYHVKSRGWSDIGYNFLVDRFGRIWEGRYGGIDKPVVGAHTLNYNQYSFAMSAIGNYDVVQPSDAMLRAYGQLFAWKLSISGVDPASMSQTDRQQDLRGDQRPPRRRLDRVPGQVPLRPDPAHPPVRLVRRAGHARRCSRSRCRSPTRRTTSTRRRTPTWWSAVPSDGRGLVIPTGGLTSFQKRTVVGKKGWDKTADVLVSPDLTGDGVGRPGHRGQVRASSGSARASATASSARPSGS